MTRKQYACIKSAQEVMEFVENMTNANTPNAMDLIRNKVHAWNHDFKDVDPGWSAGAQAEKESA